MGRGHAFTYFVAYNLLLLDIVQSRNGESALVVGIDAKVDIS